MLWPILTLMVALVVVALTVPLVRRFEARQAERQATLAVLSDELREIDAQAARGAVAPAEADALRTEVKRRMLAEGRAVDAPARPVGEGGRRAMAYGFAGSIAVAAVALYAVMGRPDLAVRPDAPAPAQPAAPPEALAMTAELEARTARQPGDAEGWRLLGWSYFNARRFADSARAYGRAVAIAPAAPGYQSAYGEALTQAADGIVTPRARAAFAAATRQDPADPRARYFLGVVKDQAGDRAGAIADWIALLRSAPADAPWAAQLREAIAASAGEAGIDVRARLPAVAAGPDAAQVAAAQAMAPGDRQAFIRSMVDGLAARLKASPRDPDGWERLIRARVVLGERDAARDALKTARAALAADADASRRMDAVATELGLASG